MSNLVVQIGHQYPFTQKEIVRLLIASYPHQNASFDSLIIDQRVSHEIVDGLLRRVCKVARSDRNREAIRQNKSVSQRFKNQQPLKQALELEKQVLTHEIEKIAALDATDLKLKPRKGSNYPGKEG